MWFYWHYQCISETLSLPLNDDFSVADLEWDVAGDRGGQGVSRQRTKRKMATGN